MNRCEWAGNSNLYIAYHDREWGVPVHEDAKFFEYLVLEGAQAGLSWLTVLKKREAYRQAFDGFDPCKVVLYGDEKAAELLNDEGIIRNRLKIRSAIQNARAFLEIERLYGSFDEYIWSYVDGKPVVGHWKDQSEVPAKSDLSDRISRDLKKRGFSFVGTTIVYSFLQATGIVMDHTVQCFRYSELQST